MFDEERDKAIEKFKKFNNEPNNDQCLDLPEKRKTLSNKEIRQLVLSQYNIDLSILYNEILKTQTEVLKFLKKLNGCSLRQLSRLTGFSVNHIFKA
ncbi:MAG: hypothetical protein JXC36_07130 [Candidatus Atribacteria bacterium]|jgi:putative transposase|nr:hypothetical protein [Candidatus Atribacteria bacterium]